MIVPIMTFPRHLLCEMLKKMDHRPLCTLRRASKTVDKTVESVRHDVSAFSQTKAAVLIILIIAKPEAKLEFHVVNQLLNHEEHNVDSIEYYHKDVTVRIEHPVKQLSAIRFHAIYVACRSTIPNDNIEQQPRETDGIHVRLVENDLVPMLRDLRASCDLVQFDSAVEAAIELMLPHIRFSKIDICAGKLHTKTMERWPIWNCEKLTLCQVRDYPEKLSTLLKNAKLCAIHFGLKEEGLYLLSEFLSEVRVNREERGTLKTLVFSASKLLRHLRSRCSYKDKLRVPGLVRIWSFPKRPKTTTTFYKVAIDGGTAIIYETSAIFEVHFVDGPDYREDLLLIAARHEFYSIPFDLSSVYEEFLSEESEETVLARLYESFRRSPKMNVPIMTFPRHLLCEMLKKMDRRSLCTLRKANKTVDQFVESVRHDVSAFSQSKPTVLYIRINAKPKAEVLFYIVSHPFDESYDTLHVEAMYKEHIIPIDDPFKQLSAFRFHSIYVAFRSFIPSDNLQQQLRKIDRIHLRLGENVLCPVLKKLRAFCDRLKFEFSFEKAIELILPHIRFSRIDIWAAKLHTKTMETWPIWNCEERILCTLRDYPQNLGTLVKNLKHGSFSFGLKEEGLYLLSDFLSEVRVNREARGKLKELEFQATKMLKHLPASHYEDKLRVPGLVQIWRGVPFRYFSSLVIKKEKITFFKSEIDEGTAIIVEDYGAHTVYFVDNDENPKERLFFVAAQHMFPRIPLDLSVFYDEFLSEDCEKTAVARFYKSYRHN